MGSGLLEAGATPEDIAGLHQWCQDQKWPDFTANVYLTRWDDYKQADQSTTGSEEELDPANDPEFLARAKLVIIKTETTQQLMERAQQTRERLMGMKVASND